MDRNKPSKQDAYKGPRMDAATAQSYDPAGTMLYADPYGDQDIAASAEEVPGVYKAPPVVEPYSVDENHGGFNQFVHPVDGAASSTEMTVYNCSAPTPEEMGFM